MCIILSCAPGARPSRELLSDCWNNNPDGGGLMYDHGGVVHVSKGYMNFSDLATAIDRVPSDAHLIVHMRIGTSGGYGPEVTHPYPITRDLELLHALDLVCPVAIAHNGVLPYPSDEALGISDTVAYVSSEVARIASMRRVRSGGGLARSSKARDLLKATSKGSRLAVLDGSGHVRLTGDGWEGVTRGIQASNGSWRYRRWGRGCVVDDWDDFDPWDDWGTDGAPLPETRDLAELMERWGCAGCDCCEDCYHYGTLCGLETIGGDEREESLF